MLKGFHRRAPFLFFNGNTFADVARQVSAAIFAEAPTMRRRELISAVAHYVAGVLDREAMMAAVEGLWRSAQLSPGESWTLCHSPSTTSIIASRSSTPAT